MLFDIRSNVRNKSTRKSDSSIVMDSSALIDGRIVDIVKSGFLARRIIVPKVVLQELQLLADGRDAHKRVRARLGLDVVIELQQLKAVIVIIDEYKKNSNQPTDELILELAKSRNADLCTTDFNLNKVATAEGVAVLNVNELAQVMRPKMLPGEIISVKIIQKGEASGQGVGYMEDGTMAVVDGAARMMKKTVSARVERMIQTKAGKMIFATLVK
jgi:uncharacterized protein YacL